MNFNRKITSRIGKSLKARLSVLVGLSVTVLSFQNCSGFGAKMSAFSSLNRVRLASEDSQSMSLSGSATVNASAYHVQWEQQLFRFRCPAITSR